MWCHPGPSCRVVQSTLLLSLILWGRAVVSGSFQPLVCDPPSQSASPVLLSQAHAACIFLGPTCIDQDIYILLDPLYRPDVDKLDPPRFVLHPTNRSWCVDDVDNLHKKLSTHEQGMPAWGNCSLRHMAPQTRNLWLTFCCNASQPASADTTPYSPFVACRVHFRPGVPLEDVGPLPEYPDPWDDGVPVQQPYLRRYACCWANLLLNH